MNITKGVIAKAQKAVIYGPEGIGKTSLASQFPDPVFIDTEGSTNNMDVARLDKPSSWIMLMQQIDFVKQTMPCKTLVVDTIDWAERLCIEYITSNANKKSITEFGYGEGFIKLEEEYGRFLNKLSDLAEMGINVVLTAHAKIVKFEQPDEMGAYDRWELKLGNKTTAKTAALTKEWADMVLFCNYKTLSVASDDKGKKFKGQGGKRVMYTSHHPAWDAKNRFGLPEELDMSFVGLAHIFMPQQVPTATQPPMNNWQTNDVPNVPQQTTPPPEPTPQPATQIATTFEREAVDYSKLPKNLADLMQANNVLPAEIMAATESKGYYPVGTPIETYDPGYIDGVLVGAWDQVFGMIKDLRTKQQF
ncbi:hypothetical protein IGI37_002104 [Enterococcus sp. AZ194]|uniref:ATP-binding protein n=1 Tax=Enterococcus sp. AZ194 TaxID=2774629 RepID=UPI003F276E45